MEVLMTKEQSLEIISKLRQNDLTDFERNVMDSFTSYLDKREKLSEKQQNLLSSIAEAYTDERIKEREEWNDSFHEKRDDFLVIVEYYRSQGAYFRPVIDIAAKDESFVPNERTYNKMVKNKYAVRVLEEHHKKPKYNVGELVYVNSKASMRDYTRMSRGGIILQADAAAVTSACRGAKKYLVLPVGDSHGLLIEERHLKRRK
jgi:hypothetical protein